MSKSKKDVYSVVTDALISAMENCGEWELPWRMVPLSHDRNHVTGTQYSGFNAIALWYARLSNGYSSPFWLTYKQAKQRGGNVKKGEHGTPIIFFKMWERENAEGNVDKIPVARYYTVFNADQIEGVDFPVISKVAEHTEPSAILAWCESVGAAIDHGGNKACYIPALDQIKMPHRSQFKSDGGYAGTMLHELTHWTGHKSRLDRLADKTKEGYAFEELVAELGAVFLCMEHGIEYQVEHHASYLKSWLKALKDNPRYLVQAAARAQKAATFCLENGTELQQAA